MPQAAKTTSTRRPTGVRAAALSDSLAPIAKAVGDALVAQVKTIGTHSSLARHKKGATARIVSINLGDLESRMTALVTKVLVRSLRANTAKAKALRMNLIVNLAHAEVGGEAATEASSAEDSVLTTAEVAAQLDVSRPYVSMLCDSGKLGEVMMTEGGHRRIRSSAVEAYLSARARQTSSAKSPRRAGVDSGLYDFPDEHYQNVVRGRPPATSVADVPKKKRRATKS